MRSLWPLVVFAIAFLALCLGVIVVDIVRQIVGLVGVGVLGLLAMAVAVGVWRPFNKR